MTNVRLDKEMEEKLGKYSQQENVTKSSIVKEALAMYFSKKEASKFPYQLGKDLFGLEGSGNPDASSNYKKVLSNKLREKHAH